jgi:hypothetical protein
MKTWFGKTSWNLPSYKSALVKPSKKCAEIPTLQSYRTNPPDSFWTNFPKNTNFDSIATPIDVQKMLHFISLCTPHWSDWQKMIAQKCIHILKNGSTTPFKYPFEFVRMPNAPSALTHGEFMTDIIANWIKKKYVIGPLDNPPCFDFSVNTLAACTAKKHKVRPIMNLSAPEHCSFNDAVNTLAVRKLTMTSPKEIGYAISSAGKGALIAKLDIVDAFKLVPAAKSEWKHFGFKWLGKYFADATTPFGSKTAPANFDCLAETIVSIVKTLSETPPNCVFRQLDDISVVAPKQSNFAEVFVKNLINTCEKIKVPLAEACPNHEKAFFPTTYGNIVGVVFYTDNLTWHFSTEKRLETLQMLKSFFNAKAINLLDFQKLHGKINAFANMFTFLKGFRFQQTAFLQKFANEQVNFLEIPQELKNEIWIWAKAIITNECGFPIPAQLDNPGLFALTFVSDAAGTQNKNFNNDCGCASIGFSNKTKVDFISTVTWTENFINFANDNSGVLESIGLLLPFLSMPEKLQNKEIILFVDNLAVVFAWSKKYAKNDEKLSIFIQTLHMIEAALTCKIYVEHVYRCSTFTAMLADALTRKATFPVDFLRSNRELKIQKPKSPLQNMIANPSIDWSFPLLLTNHIVNIKNCKENKYKK